MSTSCLLSEYKMASGVSGPHSDPHAAVSDFAEVANIIDQAKRLSLFWGQNGGGDLPSRAWRSSAGTCVRRLNSISLRSRLTASSILLSVCLWVNSQSYSWKKNRARGELVLALPARKTGIAVLPTCPTACTRTGMGS